jgi:hypothetical protein
MRIAHAVLATIVLCGCSSGFREMNPPGPDASAADGGDVDSNFDFGDAQIPDVQQPDVSDGGCTTLNIGIFGNPGANASSDFQAWLVKAGTTVARVQQSPTDVLKSSTLTPYDVVVLDWLQHDYNATEVNVLSTWVKAGKGLVVMTGYDNTVNDFRANPLIAPFGVAYDTASFLNGPVTNLDKTHPIMAGLTSISFYGGYDVLTVNANVTRTALGWIGSQPVSYAIVADQGHIFVWGDEWIQFDSEWSTIPDIAKLWVQIFKWVGPTGGCGLTPPQLN